VKKNPIYHPFPLPAARRSLIRSLLSFFGGAVLWLVLLIFAAWAAGALLYDLPVTAAIRTSAAAAYALLTLLAVIFIQGRWPAAAAVFCGGLAVLIWWRTLEPSNDRNWQPDVAEMPWADVAGDHVTLHNVRNCEYRTEMDYTPHWETRTVELSHLRGIDLAINYWGSAWMAHPIVSFQFDNAPPICFSIETRKVIGQSYSAIGGLYRQFELIYICAEERDVIRVRTNYRHGEVVYLYRTTMTPERARERFLEYVSSINTLRAHPRWYNAAATNCTTSIRSQHAASERRPWDWRILINGYADQMLYAQGAFAGDLPFAELKQQALINESAQAADTDPDFSERIRAGRAGFASAVAHQ
jgi:hypothetical protein